MGLGPGLVPSGDSMVSGVLLALRLLGGAISGGTRAVWLANWLSAAVTCDAAQRTTTLAASLLHCAASGQAAAEVSAVLLGMAGQEPLEPAGRPAARGGPGRRSGLGPGGRLPRGAAAVRILSPVIIPLTGLQYEIEAGPYRATVTELGAGLRELSFRGQPVIAGYEADELPPAGAGQLLAPWPNRIDGGRYVFGGTEYQLALTEPARGNAIHGLTRWAAWTVDPARGRRRAAAQRAARPAGISVLPGDRGRVPARSRRRAAGRPSPRATAAASAAPYGTGSHPYLTVGTPSVDGCELTLPAGSWLPMDDRGIPSGPPEPVDGTPYDFRQPRVIGSTRLDHALTGLSRDDDGRAWAHLAADGGAGPRVGLWAGPGLPLAAGVHRRPARAGPPPQGGGHRAHDLPAERLRDRRRPAGPRAGRQVTHTWGIQASG